HTAVDVLNVFDDSSAADKTGLLTATNLSGLGMSTGLTFAHTAFGEPNTFAGGITFGDAATGKSTVEGLNLLLGTGADHMDVARSLDSDAAHGGLTVLHGGGGSDTFIVTGGGGPSAPLVIYGDTSQDGRWYAGDPAAPSADSFGVIGSTDFRFPLADP